MNPTPPGYELIRIRGINTFWVGANPFQKGLLVGSDRGVAVFTDLTGNEMSCYQLLESEEAIDAIAGFDPYMAVSTRHEVTVFDLSTDMNTPAASAVVPRGSHGVVAGNGYFLAPIGQEGILVITPSRDSLTNYRIDTFPGNPLNFYQVCKLPDCNGARCFVAACRNQGLAVLDGGVDGGVARGRRISRGHDMHGNIVEWCRDRFHQKLPGGKDPDLHDAKATALPNRTGDYSRSRRGSAWTDEAWASRSAFRQRFEPVRHYDHIGFRVVAVRR